MTACQVRFCGSGAGAKGARSFLTRCSRSTMAITIPAVVTENLSKVVATYEKLTTAQKVACGVAGGLATLALVTKVSQARDTYKLKPSSFELSGGSIEASKVKGEFQAYTDSYGQNAGDGILDRSKTVHLVDVFYSLVTDFYEWGWGQSFHFSPKLPAKTWKASEAAHEARIAATLGLKPGMKCLDCGCGVGGPLRTIASVSGANVTGITINEYQVGRARYHNKKQRVEPLTTVVKGDFLKMPFEASTFDGAYAIEATCHAPKLEDVYSEVFRVLKPGAMFVSYEWVSTKVYDPKVPAHVKIIDEINYGNGLPEMRTWQQAEEAGKAAGFELVGCIDLAIASPVCGPWYHRLSAALSTIWINQSIVNTLHFFGLMPRGMKEVHDMLMYVAKSLVAGGETGIFTPMYMLTFRKPAAAEKSKK